MFLESLDKIQGLVENKFQDIRNTGRSRLHFPGQPCTSEHLQVFMYWCNLYVKLKGLSDTLQESRKKSFGQSSYTVKELFFIFFVQILVRAVPIKQGHKLRIVWPITPSIHYYKEAPCRYLSHLIGHEGEGSLFYILKTLGRFSEPFIFLTISGSFQLHVLETVVFENLTQLCVAITCIPFPLGWRCFPFSSWNHFFFLNFNKQWTPYSIPFLFKMVLRTPKCFFEYK